MPNDVTSVSRISDVLINDQEANSSNGKLNQHQVDSADALNKPHPPRQFSEDYSVYNTLQQPRDRANSVDNHYLRSLFPQVVECSSRWASSSSSSMSLTLPMGFTRNLQNSSLKNTSQSTTFGLPGQSRTSPRSAGLLYNLLISTDSQLQSGRLKQPLAPSTSSNSSTSEAKKPKPEEPMQRSGNAEFMGVRRFSFSGDASHAEELQSYMEISNRIPTIPFNFKSIFDRRFEENIAMSVQKASTLPHPTSACSSILSALIASTHSSSSPGLSSTSTDSGLDEPLDLTPRKSPNEPVQLAKKTASPIQRRISEFLRLAAEFVHSSNTMPTHWWTVYKATWHRLVMIAMAEDALDVVFVESPHADEHLKAGEPVLPWLSLPADPSKLVPNRLFAERVIDCVDIIRNQNLDPEEFKTLRMAVLITVTQPSTLSQVGVEMLQKTRRDKLGDNVSNEEVKQSLCAIECGLILMENLPMAPFAGLFCSHLRGEPSKDIFSEKLRSSIPCYSNPRESILDRLVCEISQPALKATQDTP